MVDVPASNSKASPEGNKMRTACCFCSFQGEVPAIRFHESVYDMGDWFWWFNTVIWYVIYDIHIYVTSSNLTQPLSPQKMLVSSTNSQPKKEKTSKPINKKNDSRDSWMYPNQRTPTRNPYISPREYNKYHGYTVRGRPNCPLNDPNDYCKQYTTRLAGRLPCSLSPFPFPGSPFTSLGGLPVDASEILWRPNFPENMDWCIKSLTNAQ